MTNDSFVFGSFSPANQVLKIIDHITYINNSIYSIFTLKNTVDFFFLEFFNNLMSTNYVRNQTSDFQTLTGWEGRPNSFLFRVNPINFFYQYNDKSPIRSTKKKGSKPESVGHSTNENFWVRISFLAHVFIIQRLVKISLKNYYYLSYLFLLHVGWRIHWRKWR